MNSTFLDTSQKFNDGERYWFNKLTDDINMSSFSYYRNTNYTNESGEFRYTIPANISAELMKISNHSEYGIYILLTCGIKYLLSIYTRSNDICIGTPVINSPGSTTTHNQLLILRSKIEGEMTVKDLLLSIKEEIYNSNNNQHISISTVKEHIGLHASPRTIVSLKNINSRHIDTSIHPDTSFQFEINEVGISCNIEYKGNSRENIDRLWAQLNRFFQAVIENPNRNIYSIEITSPQEKEMMSHIFNDTSRTVARNTVIEMFESQVLKNPESLAVVFKDKKMTYRELNNKANILANRLIKEGVKEGCIVGLVLDRCLELPIVTLGILKTGAAYMPIDPNYPNERIKSLIYNSELSYLVKKSSDLNNLTLNVKHCDIDKVLNESSDAEAEKNPVVNVSPHCLMYVLYTSGSTGEPKGVMIKKDSFLNLLTWYTEEFDMNQNDNILLIAPISFDTSHKNIFAPLVLGGCLHIFESGAYDYNNMSNYIQKNKITIINCTPSGFYPIVSYNEETNFSRLTSLRYAFLGGESINTKKIKPLLEHSENKCELVNTYGPTECTDIACSYRINTQDIQKTNIPIGKPITNTELFIVDENINVLPIGVVGEVLISGAGVSLGYNNSSKLNNEKFIEFPLGTEKRAYKTGDLARWLPDGNIEFIGRQDNLTKIRGYRIEISEVENYLTKHQDVDEAVVIVIDDVSGSKALSAYFTSPQSISYPSLRKFLLENIPEFMVPSYFTRMKKLPLNQNGKVDRKSLPTPNIKTTNNLLYTAPETKTEIYIAEIWEEILGVKNVGSMDDFFELGGHSLKAASIILKVNHKLGIDLQISDIFSNPTIKGLADLASNERHGEKQSISRTALRDYYPVSFQQKRLFVLWQLNKESTAYNLPSATILKGQVEKNLLTKALRFMVSKHEALRTSFSFKNVDLVQKINQEVTVDIEFIENFEGNLDNQLKEFIKPFDLESGPIFRAKIIRLSENKHLLFTDVHHIVFDGISMKIVMQDFIKYYNNYQSMKAERNLTYKDYAVWQESYVQTAKFKESEQYWLSRFHDYNPNSGLNTDYLRPATPDLLGDQLLLNIEPQLAYRLKQLAVNNGTTLYTLMLAALNVLIYKHTGENDITIGTPTAGRFHSGLENIVGMFVNTLALRNRLEENKSFTNLLKDVKENVINSIKYEDYPFELLVDRLKISRQTGRNPLFDIIFSVENIELEENIDGNGLLNYSNYPLDSGMSQFDMSIDVYVQEEEMEIKFKYASQLFKRETVESLAHHFVQLLNKVTENADEKIKDINILSSQEEYKLLTDFNNTHSYYKGSSLQELFERQCMNTPNATALVYSGQSISFRELDRKSNQLARYLQKQGVERENVVGISSLPNVESIVGILSILKAGGAYLPIDPKFPEEHIKYLMKDSGCKFVLAENSSSKQFLIDTKVLELNPKTYEAEDNSKLNFMNEPSDLAYVIYTSGTTGNPKGVMIEHQNIVNQLEGLKDSLPIEPGLHHLLLAKFNFDAAVQQIFLPLVSGGVLFIPENQVISHPKELWNYIVQNKVDVLDTVPSHISVFMKWIDAHYFLKLVILGGEVLPKKICYELLEKCNIGDLINIYGPTETAINATYYTCKKGNEASIPIGKPLRNYKTYIVDKNFSPVPIGVIGELCIAGSGVGRGYIGKEDLTKNKFILNPFNPVEERMYRTGDLAKWLPNGDIEYVGRLDQQVKIKGIRIEPNEVRTVLLEHPNIVEAAVVAKKNANQNDYFLCAYVTSKESISSTTLRTFLKDNLPDYMIPAHFVRLDKMPLMSNDKLDLKYLIERKDEKYLASEIEYESPSTKIEEIISRVWREVLCLEEISRHDHFFELGGNSLNVVQVNEKLKEELNMEINIVTLFRYDTIYSLAKELYEQEEKKERGNALNREFIRESSKDRLLKRRSRKRE
ncbi:hypothetical protein BEH_10695 [Priestia filamentosa]|uniref:Uncharacterized protein n=1 Tax=Priestia filamentosa TaxID=1402861 RepID=A0A1X7E6M5_9BACI|nr:non-ribosomal peptide synthetase [Priestia filamentosa]AKO92516.1 hypothetical protein BEH_10695 [Priestia filamentosa]MDT3762585.1 non-ribosomal peptide synthetase [Priestia filamentosa]OXS69133.1 non-ribosomal peptide synthetase [Priestia filamentosa]WRU97049.1 non-ribosomal peptide synthetase [Priestia filamentosa]SMF28453.1 amino acid adenylation domain-containing protein [Priestia filamentosa]